MHAVGRPQVVQALDRGANRDGAGADDELVVADEVGAAVGGSDRQAPARDVDVGGESVEP